MFLVHLVCSDPGCAEEVEAVVENIEDLERLVCECGYGTVLVSVAELDRDATVIELRADGAPRRLAA